jgi:hypothetical protein
VMLDHGFTMGRFDIANRPLVVTQGCVRVWSSEIKRLARFVASKGPIWYTLSSPSGNGTVVTARFCRDKGADRLKAIHRGRVSRFDPGHTEPSQGAGARGGHEN